MKCSPLRAGSHPLVQLTMGRFREQEIVEWSWIKYNAGISSATALTRQEPGAANEKEPAATHFGMPTCSRSDVRDHLPETSARVRQSGRRTNGRNSLVDIHAVDIHEERQQILGGVVGREDADLAVPGEARLLPLRAQVRAAGARVSEARSPLG